MYTFLFGNTVNEQCFLIADYYKTCPIYERVSDSCSMPKTSYISTRWCWYQLCTRSIRL